MKNVPMRRKDRQMSKEEALEMLRDAPFVYLATAGSDGIPYCVPVNLVMTDDSTAYFHGLTVGRKIENITANPSVCISCAESCGAVPSSRTKEGFVLTFRSVVAFGTAGSVTDIDEKSRVLTLLCKKFLDPSLDAFHHISESVSRSAKITGVYKINLLSVTGKKTIDKSSLH